MELPDRKWTRKFNAHEPPSNQHSTFTPPILEALSLLPLAYRIGSYIDNERKNGRDPIFDFYGIALQPPHPGPYAGVPLGGLGGGSIGRGCRGEFRRWFIHPEKYVHNNIVADNFSLRVKRNNKVEAVVLSVSGTEASKTCLSSWNWTMSPSCATYHALFPFSWCVYENPLPDITVVIKQISPFIPGNYSESSLPAGVFDVEVINTSSTSSAEVSVMFSFQNGYGSEENTPGGLVHGPFSSGGEDPNGVTVKGVCMTTTHEKTYQDGEIYVDRGSIAIASSSADEDGSTLSFCSQFISNYQKDSSWFANSCGSAALKAEMHSSARVLWDDFVSTGDIGGSLTHVSHEGTNVAAAVCLRFTVSPRSDTSSSTNNRKSFPFALAWDQPMTRFGTGKALPRYYTRFFGASGLSAPGIASFALRNFKRWEEQIRDWQNTVTLRSPFTIADFNEELQDTVQSTSDSPCLPHQRNEVEVTEKGYFNHLLFNELYYLVDGGTVWTDSTSGFPNNPLIDVTCTIATGSSSIGENSVPDGEKQLTEPLTASRDFDEALSPIKTFEDFKKQLASIQLSALSATELEEKMVKNDQAVRFCGGDSREVGQFIYLEGHEYLMINTYDVHFYSSFALLSLFPQIELSLQRDFSKAVPMEDLTQRKMMANGSMQPRKVRGVVPHDLGTPSEFPWQFPNSYNLQDVSRWKDLGPKFVLQVYRDYFHLKKSLERMEGGEIISARTASAEKFLKDLYPTVVGVMHNTALFDLDGDGMIENSNFPDQTYDVWTASGVHAYCGGLWIAACEAAVTMASILEPDSQFLTKFQDYSLRAREVYIRKLWNGTYLNYDSSNSTHFNSIMSDMMAGQWYALSCGLPPLLTPKQALSCFRVIYQQNVVIFGEGKFKGAVNGMRPPGWLDTSTADRPEKGHRATIVNSSDAGTVDSTCLQSKEVWTGTTYGLAAAMLMQAKYISKDKIFGEEGKTESSLLSVQERRELLEMANNTARGIHDAGWQEYGYWFATPEAWTKNGNYRALGYMRPLSVWAMQYAAEF